MIVQRDGNRILVTEPLGFNFDDGRLVLTLLQARELEDLLHSNRAWIFDEVEAVGHEDG